METVYDRIEKVLAARELHRGEASRVQLEDALTTGYAAALELEAERARLERRIGELTRRLAGSEGRDWAELAELAQRKAHVEHDVARLRAMLEPLRGEVREARASAS